MKGQSLLLAVLSAAVQIGASAAFLSPKSRLQIINHQRPQDSIFRKNAAADDSDNDKTDAKEEEGLGFTALPPIGGSSFWDDADADYADTTAYTNDNDTSTGQKNIVVNAEHTNLVSPKFKLQYTCKICSTRNSHSVTRMAYRKGIVIAVCKGCHSKHLIADNLGWSNYIGGFDFDNGETDIEKYMQNQAADGSSIGTVAGEKENELVMRVTQDVFDLETMLHKGQEQGKKAMSGNNNDIADGEDVNDEMSWS